MTRTKHPDGDLSALALAGAGGVRRKPGGGGATPVAPARSVVPLGGKALAVAAGHGIYTLVLS